jgi:hypothetical protein
MATRHRAPSYDRETNTFFAALEASKAALDAGKTAEAGRAIEVPTSDAREANRWIRDAATMLKLSARIDMYGTDAAGKRIGVTLGIQKDGHDIVLKGAKETDYKGKTVHIEFCAAALSPRPRTKPNETPSVNGTDPSEDAATSDPAAGTAPSDTTGNAPADPAPAPEPAPVRQPGARGRRSA